MDDTNDEEFYELLLERVEAIVDANVESFLTIQSLGGIEIAEDLKKFTDKGFVNELLTANKGGKGLRALLFIDTALKCFEMRDIDTENLEDILYIAAALELLQTSMLIHDDIIDNDETRRGRKASHISIGANKAIILGDLILSIADFVFSSGVHRLATNDIIDFEISQQMYAVWAIMKRDVLFGQVIDNDFTKTDLTVAKNKTKKQLETLADEFEFIAMMKTASYTTIAPVILGLIVGKNVELSEVMDADELDQLIKRGLLFQISNDMSDYQKDISAGNISGQLVYLLLEYHGKPEFEKITTIIKKGAKITASDLKFLQSLRTGDQNEGGDYKVMEI